MTTNKPEVAEHLKNLERITSEAVADAYRLRRLWQFSASMISANSSKIRPRGKDEERLIKLAKEADHGAAWSGRTDGWITESMTCSIAVTQPAEQKPVCPTCPTCYGRGWDMDCQNEFRPATCPDCAGSGKAEHSITVQESDSVAPDVSALVDALEAALGSFDDWCEGQDPSDIADAIDTFPWVVQARTALSAHRKGGDAP